MYAKDIYGSAKRQQRVEQLKSLAGKCGAGEIAAHMGCSEQAVKCLAQRNGISLAIDVTPWSREHEEYVRRNAQSMTMPQMSQVLGRSVISIKAFCQRKNISMMKRGQYHHAAIATDEDVELCRQLHEAKMPLKMIARKMEFSIHLVRNIVYYQRS